MANPLKGEVGFEVNGAAWTASFSVNALVTLEDALGVSVTQIGALMAESVSMKTLRTIFWAALLDHHKVTEAEAGEVMTAFGIEAAAGLVGQAFSLAFPQEDAKATARPPKRAGRAGNG